MNCAISRNRNSRLARPAHDFVIEAEHLVGRPHRPRSATVGEPCREEDDRDDHDQAVHERRVPDDVARYRIAERCVGQEGEEPDRDEHAERREEREAKPSRLGLRRHLGALVGIERLVVALVRRVVRPEATLDDAHRDERHDEGDEDRRGDAEVQVRCQVDRAVGVDEPARVVRDLRQDTVERSDQEVDAEAGGDTRERGRDAGERVSTDALERCRP